jgi:hypothetical protein
VTDGGELQIDPVKMEATVKWPVPTNVNEFRIFVQTAQYLWNFIEYFSSISTPLHTIKTSGKGL